MNKKLGILLGIIVLLLCITSCKKGNVMNDYPNIEDKHHVFEELEINDVLTTKKQVLVCLAQYHTSYKIVCVFFYVAGTSLVVNVGKLAGGTLGVKSVKLLILERS